MRVILDLAVRQDLTVELGMNFEAQLDKLAEVAVKVGVGLLPGQKLLLSAPIETAPLARKVVEHAYKAGSRLVTVLWNDEPTSLARYQYAPRNSFEEVPDWQIEGTTRALEENHAYLAISGEDPALLKDQDPELVATASKARAQASKRSSDLISSGAVNWSIVPSAIPVWARMVFPDQSEAQAVQQLWENIFKVCRIDQPNPVAAWQHHAANLVAKMRWLNAQQFSILHFRGPGTNLRVGLVEGHVWVGASSTAKNGAVCIPNMPTEEIFTMPHAGRVEGYVRASKPLSLRGNLIEGIWVRFEEGQIVEAKADKGEEVLQKLLDTDEGARRLGEVALVPHSSPVSQSGLLYYDTLFDENAASHIALGQCYSENLKGYEGLSPEERQQAGANQSLVHVDWMIGSDRVDVDGITTSGHSVAVMRGGEWV